VVTHHRNDEIGTMTRAIEVVPRAPGSKGQRRRSGCHEGAERGARATLARQPDPPHQLPLPDAYEPVCALFNDMVARLAQLIGTVTIVARRVAESAREINSASTDLASRNEHHAGRISEALMAITQVSAMVGDAARDSVDMQASVEQAHDQAATAAAR
jgi:methyl-accepting chemotaxis protein